MFEGNQAVCWEYGVVLGRCRCCSQFPLGSFLLAEFAHNSATFGLPAVVAARGGITDRVAFWQSWSSNLPSWVIPRYWTADQVQRSLDELGNVP